MCIAGYHGNWMLVADVDDDDDNGGRISLLQ